MGALIGTVLFFAVAQATLAITPQEIVHLANRERARPLALNAQLTAAAERKLDDMRDAGYFDHSHGSSTFGRFMRDAGYNYKAAAENLAQGFRSAEDVHKAWMRSKGHRRNILGDFTDIGVAVKGDLIVVMFARR